jgi:phage-related tail fiber protein
MTDIKDTINVDGNITATGDITDGSSNKLSKKLDKLTTGPTAGTYTSVTVNTEGQVTAGSNPTTLAGYGITDAVPALTTAPTAGDYTKVTINADGLVTAGSNPTTLAGYGITDAVNTTGDQTGIAGAKTWTGDHTFNGGLTRYATAFSEIAIKSGRATGNLGGVQSYDSSNNLRTAYSGNAQANNESRAQIYAYDASNSGNRNILTVGFDPNQTGANRFYAVLANQRDYNSANTGDIVTIGSLASNPNVVHTTGNETIAGYKTFSSGALYALNTNHKMLGSDESAKNNTHISTVSPDGTTEIRMTVIANNGGTGSITISKFLNGSYVNSTTIGTI